MMAAGVHGGPDFGVTPVVESRALEAVKLAVELGQDVNAANTAATLRDRRDLPGRQGANTIIRFLVDHGAKSTSGTNEGGHLWPSPRASTSVGVTPRLRKPWNCFERSAPSRHRPISNVTRPSTRVLAIEVQHVHVATEDDALGSGWLSPVGVTCSVLAQQPAPRCFFARTGSRRLPPIPRRAFSPLSGHRRA